jgi:hypothetical protein
LFTDASHKHWGLIETQVPPEDIGPPLAIQCHQLLAFLSGLFSGAQIKCSIIEKEAFPMMQAIDRLRRFLVAEKVYRIFTDHRNLLYVFDHSAHFRQHTAEKFLDGLAICMNIIL